MQLTSSFISSLNKYRLKPHVGRTQRGVGKRVNSDNEHPVLVYVLLTVFPVVCPYTSSKALSDSLVTHGRFGKLTVGAASLTASVSSAQTAHRPGTPWCSVLFVLPQRRVEIFRKGKSSAYSQVKLILGRHHAKCWGYREQQGALFVLGCSQIDNVVHRCSGEDTAAQQQNWWGQWKSHFRGGGRS